jgi:futalosine hydrolase
MKILIVAATEAEIGALVESRKSKVESQNSDHGPSTMDHGLEFLITGVGMTATAFALGKHLAKNTYDLAISLGIAGSFDRGIALGDVVEIRTDIFSELGAENDDQFLTLDAMGFGQTTFSATSELADYYSGQSLQQVSAITVNTVHGNDASILKLQQRINPQLESMEGAAFFYACEQAGVPALQIRTVSNYVEKRNRDAWQIALAVKNLNNFALNLLRVVGCEL